MKRLFDVACASLGLFLLSPLLFFIAIWIKFDSEGPVFYRGRRAGWKGKPFGIFKFRSMVTNADKIGGPSTSDDDPRVTRSGRFIRRFKLDELSQLLNVLIGDMSLVGPRPEVVDKIADLGHEYKLILDVRPGITDWASIWNADEGALLSGSPDPDEAYERVIRPIKLKLQKYYCETRSMGVDLRIIFYTLYKIVRKNWVPRELECYPSFEELRVEVAELSAERPNTQPNRVRKADVS